MPIASPPFGSTVKALGQRVMIARRRPHADVPLRAPPQPIFPDRQIRSMSAGAATRSVGAAMSESAASGNETVTVVEVMSSMSIAGK
jgi:hypothetical protein